MKKGLTVLLLGAATGAIAYRVARDAAHNRTTREAHERYQAGKVVRWTPPAAPVDSPLAPGALKKPDPCPNAPWESHPEGSVWSTKRCRWEVPNADGTPSGWAAT